jgi:uncharacterized protein (TIGR03066 family)
MLLTNRLWTRKLGWIGCVALVLCVGTVGVLARCNVRGIPTSSTKPASATQFTESSLLGTWEAETQLNRAPVRTVVELSGDGQLLLNVVNGKRETNASGSWTLEDNILTVKVGRDAATQHTLRWLAANQFEATELRSSRRTIYTRQE